ncbi:MAG: adenylyl-sulfate kinase [Bacteroidota bacterium]
MQTDKNIIYQNFKINKIDRNKENGHNSIVIWFTGLSGSGKSTIANALQNKLFTDKIHCFTLDGDNTRLGINSDLDFSDLGRKENIRRVAEICKLMNDAGTVVIASFISPFLEDRMHAKAIIGPENFIEVFVDCPIEVCESRDVKGLYAKARNNEIKNFTGISSPFEVPLHPEIHVKSNLQSVEDCVKQIDQLLKEKLKLHEL